MDPLTKVRIELLDENTGNPITEVDAITSSETIIYTNPNPTPADVGSLPKGTTFNKTPLKTILDGILYSYKEPTIKEIKIENTDFPYSITVDKTIVKQRHTIVPSFQYSVTVENGTATTLSCIVKVYKDDATVDQHTAQINTEIGKTYSFNFTINEISQDSTIHITIIDGTNTIVGPYIRYKFVDPIYIGFATPTLLTDYGELVEENLETIINYFEGVIPDVNTDFLTTRYVEKSDQYATSYDVDFDHKKIMNPIILIPQYWGNALAILDSNGLNITKSYSLISGVNLNMYEDEVISYLLYMHRGSFDINSTFISGIKYCFELPETEEYPSLSEAVGKGTPISAPFDVQYEVAIDSRFVVGNYQDLLGIKFPYNGLLTYVEDIDTFFRYVRGTWLPTSTRVYVIESEETLTEDFGGWDDVAICTNGNIYRKRYNNVWELWGTIAGSGGEIPEYQQYRFNEEYDPTKTYLNNNRVVDLVYHNGSTYYCKQNCIGIEPTNDGVHWTYFARGCECVNPPTDESVQFHNVLTGENIPIEQVIAKNLETGEIVTGRNIKFKEVSKSNGSSN